MKFNELLVEFDSSVTLSRKELIQQLKSYHVLFRSLDDITYIRWLKGKTQPSLHKQILLARFFKYPLSRIVEVLDCPKTAKKEEMVYKKVFSLISNSYHQVYYQHLTKNMVMNRKVLTTQEHRDLLGQFYRSLSIYNDVFNQMDTSGHTIDNIRLFCYESDGEVISHTSYISNFEQFSKYFSFKDGRKIKENSLIINASYYLTKDIHHALFGVMMNDIIDQHPDTETVYIAFRGRVCIPYMEVTGGDVIWSHHESEELGGTYISEFEIEKLLSNSLILSLTKNNVENYRGL